MTTYPAFTIKTAHRIKWLYGVLMAGLPARQFVAARAEYNELLASHGVDDAAVQFIQCPRDECLLCTTYVKRNDDPDPVLRGSYKLRSWEG